MKEIIRRIKRDAFVQAFLRGFGACAEIYTVHYVPPPRRSAVDVSRGDRDALRSDWLKIGVISAASSSRAESLILRTQRLIGGGVDDPSRPVPAAVGRR
jgi:hypothetical protein